MGHRLPLQSQICCLRTARPVDYTAVAFMDRLLQMRSRSYAPAHLGSPLPYLCSPTTAAEPPPTPRTHRPLDSEQLAHTAALVEQLRDLCKQASGTASQQLLDWLRTLTRVREPWQLALQPRRRAMPAGGACSLLEGHA